MGEGPATTLSKRWRRCSRSLDGGFRAAYLRAELAAHPLPDVASALERICSAAEQAEPDAREVLVSVVDVLSEPESSLLAQTLREEAAGRSLLALARLLRRPLSNEPRAPSEDNSQAEVPDYGTKRPLTLGERRALARRPTRKGMEKLLSDPHPMVIRTLLANPKLVEDDVVRLAARRPGRPAVLSEIARSRRWAHRIRVRMAILMNPDTPAPLSIPLLALLVRPELRQIVHRKQLLPVVRAAARDLLARRPPAPAQARPPKLQ